MSAYIRQKAKSKYRNRVRLERSSQKQSSDTHKTSYDRVKRCRERKKKKIKASERVNVDVFTQNKRPCPHHSKNQYFFCREEHGIFAAVLYAVTANGVNKDGASGLVYKDRGRKLPYSPAVAWNNMESHGKPKSRHLDRESNPVSAAGCGINVPTLCHIAQLLAGSRSEHGIRKIASLASKMLPRLSYANQLLVTYLAACAQPKGGTFAACSSQSDTRPAPELRKQNQIMLNRLTDTAREVIVWIIVKGKHGVRDSTAMRHSWRSLSENTWCGFIVNQLIGPVIVDNRLTGERLLKAVHDQVSTFEINLIKKSLLLPVYILTGTLSDMRPAKVVTMEGKVTRIIEHMRMGKVIWEVIGTECLHTSTTLNFTSANSSANQPLAVRTCILPVEVALLLGSRKLAIHLFTPRAGRFLNSSCLSHNRNELVAVASCLCFPTNKQKFLMGAFSMGKISAARYAVFQKAEATLTFQLGPDEAELECNGERETGVPRENPPASGIVQHDSTCENLGANPPGIEPRSPWWEVSALATALPLPLQYFLALQVLGVHERRQLLELASAEHEHKTRISPNLQFINETEKRRNCNFDTLDSLYISRWRDWGRTGKESAMAFVRDPSHHSPGIISGNHGKPKSGWSDLESNPCPSECESSELPLRHLARNQERYGKYPTVEGSGDDAIGGFVLILAPTVRLLPCSQMLFTVLFVSCITFRRSLLLERLHPAPPLPLHRAIFSLFPFARRGVILGFHRGHAFSAWGFELGRGPTQGYNRKTHDGLRALPGHCLQYNQNVRAVCSIRRVIKPLASGSNIGEWRECLIATTVVSVPGKTGDPRENPPSSDIVRDDSHIENPGVTRPGIESELIISLGTLHPFKYHKKPATSMKTTDVKILDCVTIRIIHKHSHYEDMADIKHGDIQKTNICLTLHVRFLDVFPVPVSGVVSETPAKRFVRRSQSRINLAGDKLAKGSTTRRNKVEARQAGGGGGGAGRHFGFTSQPTRPHYSQQPARCVQGKRGGGDAANDSRCGISSTACGEGFLTRSTAMAFINRTVKLPSEN
ncbi:hypothetical protein PR048_006288 [Dryococelus australis]|uniref:Uncharacterized protein n=1 Tax=Dryococelus australis TaxID=614101 RepID=A0ABQ9IAI9_9NEOP|nr:hypothetical protein PR048_006288 [Dryococelus australis]